MSFVDIIKIVGACAAVVGTCYSILNSKRVILWRIDHKEAQISRIDYKLAFRERLNRDAFYPISDLDVKRDKLVRQIDNLKRYL